jgi:hypothetical protein
VATTASATVYQDGEMQTRDPCSQSIWKRFPRLREGSRIVLQKPDSGVCAGADSPLITALRCFCVKNVS